MDKRRLINTTRKFIEMQFKNDNTGHDHWHIFRVSDMAVRLAKAEGADVFITELSALLHDIADHKFHNNDLNKGPEVATGFLQKNDADSNTIEKVVAIIKEVSYKGAGVETAVTSIESAVVQDADRLDAIGAIGIARVFAYGGFANQTMHNPIAKPQLHNDFMSYASAETTSINHFYEKLLLLKDRMNTASAKKIAEGRHLFMQGFLNEFYAEWKAEK